MSLLKKIFIMVLAIGFVIPVWVTGDEVDVTYSQIRLAGPRYVVQSREVNFWNEGMRVNGTLTVPVLRRSYPIVMTLNGFGGYKDEANIPGTNEGILSRTARILGEQGFCVLQVEFRGQRDSDGDYSMTSFSSQISDVLAAVEYIQGLGDPVDKTKIGLIGFSQGGLVGSIAASKDPRIDSIVLWSAPAFPPHDYEGLITKQGIRQGLALPDGGSANFPIYVEGTYFWDVSLGKQFFVDLFSVAPLPELRHYGKSMMYISGLNDIIVWPQPQVGYTFLNYHDGEEKLVILDADHAFNYWDGPVPEKLDDAIYWSTAWFIETLKKGKTVHLDNSQSR